MNLSHLNQAQYEAVTYPLKSIMVMAGAGTGKTTVITNRIAYLISYYKINPEKILSITFTNKAANEMNDRIKNIIGESLNWIGTFHQICIKILRREIHKLNRKNNFKILGDNEDAISILKEIYDNCKIDKNDISYKNMLNIIDDIKNNLYDVDQLQNNHKLILKYNIVNCVDKVKLIYSQYIQKLEIYNYLDFNDILNFTYFILSNFNDSLEYWSNKFDCILVDEFQDTNDIQYNLIKLLASKSKNIFAVGDEDQSIYSFRGAKPDIIQSFLSYDDNNVNVIKLEENYRSNQEILNVANFLINKNPSRIVKNLYSKTIANYKPKFYIANSIEDEANFVVRKIQQLMHENNDLKYNDFAILYRSNYLSRSFEHALMYEGIKYNLYGGFKFYQRTEIKDIIAYLNVIDNNDDISIKRIINIPRRKISDTTVKHIMNYCNNHNLTFYDGLCNVDSINELSSIQKQSVHNFINLIDYFKNIKFNSINELIDELLTKIDYEKYVVANDSKKAEYIFKNIEELKKGVTNFEIKNTNNSLSSYLQEVNLFSILDEKNKKNENAVSLMTVHASKGLEFKNVFLVEFNDGCFPSEHSIMENNIVEERRLAYVAITRAKENLYILCNNNINIRTKNRNIPSRFIKDIELLNLDQIKNQFTLKSDYDLEWFDSKLNNQIKKENNYNSNEINNFKIGDKIVHTTFGLGTIIGINNDILEISFNPPYNIKYILFNHKLIKRQII